jgi:ribosomal protein S18 acetylase RimI-like enzyme
MSEVVIRRATLEDAAEIANVHINSWREAYKGMLPQDFLDDRPLYFKNRYQLWKRVTSNPSEITFVAESKDNGIVGFINGSKPRDPEYQDYAEVTSVYLLKKYHGKKIGYQLLREFFGVARAQGFNKAYLWVIENNPTIKFYERSGGVFNNHKKEDTIANQKVSELCYVWTNLDLENEKP